MDPGIPPFEAHPLLKNGHAMTVAAAYLPRRFAIPPAEARLFQVDAESQLLGHCHWQAGKRKDAPVLVIVHGLEGSSDSNYERGIAEKAFPRGFHVVRLNQRNCGGTENLTPTLYHSGLSGDIRAVVRELAERDGLPEIFAAGFSMGGNLVLKMAGEYGNSAPQHMRGFVAVAPSFDLAACADALLEPRNFIYERHFVRRLKRRMREKARLYPEQYGAVLNGGMRGIHTVRDFDDAITARFCGFQSADDYYARSSAAQFVAAIRKPTLLLTAQDDPFVPFATFASAAIRENPNITLVAPRHGGHCGFISRERGEERFWCEARIVEFCSGTSMLLRRGA